MTCTSWGRPRPAQRSHPYAPPAVLSFVTSTTCSAVVCTPDGLVTKPLSYGQGTRPAPAPTGRHVTACRGSRPPSFCRTMPRDARRCGELIPGPRFPTPGCRRTLALAGPGPCCTSPHAPDDSSDPSRAEHPLGMAQDNSIPCIGVTTATKSPRNASRRAPLDPLEAPAHVSSSFHGRVSARRIAIRGTSHGSGAQLHGKVHDAGGVSGRTKARARCLSRDGLDSATAERRMGAEGRGMKGPCRTQRRSRDAGGHGALLLENKRSGYRYGGGSHSVALRAQADMPPGRASA